MPSDSLTRISYCWHDEIDVRGWLGCWMLRDLTCFGTIRHQNMQVQGRTIIRHQDDGEGPRRMVVTGKLDYRHLSTTKASAIHT